MAKKKSPVTLDAPPFPPLTWNGYFWSSAIVLPSWNSFQGQESNASIEISISVEDEQHPPTPEQSAAYRYLIDHEKQLADIILQGIYDEHPWWNYDYYEEEIEESGQLSGRIQFDSILFHQVARDGMAYLGFSFGCEWDEEHGLGVMVHRDRVVAIGGGDVAILAWIASGDAGETS